ncbi:unnamed protein product [Caenorhabditis bovis]|uniref:Cwf18 pre-mRNA splicing factor n=1 Tax=Caenorhabditis bovis TaxID=2654633 RepID=A0A8S1F582_9PELO|nr:unnamed protein product [Caenorhabditis bovis]
MTDVDNDNQSDEDIESMTSRETSLEAAAKARKRRLMEMKSRIHGVPMEEEDYEKEEQETKKTKEQKKEFRNHKPDEAIGSHVSGIEMDAVEREIADHLKDVLHEKPIESIDLAMLAPRKIDWDLKRDIEGKMARLERKTQKAIAEIIRHRLAQGKGDLASTVNAASM